MGTPVITASQILSPRDYVVVEVQPASYDDVDDYDRTTGSGDPDGDDER